MTRRTQGGGTLDIALLSTELRAVFGNLLNGESVTITEQGAVRGNLVFTPRVLEGSLIAPSSSPEQPAERPRGDVCVVATAMPLSESAKSRLARGFGEHYIVLDLVEAPASADVVLTHPVSPQLLHKLKEDFPAARIVVAEIEDEEAGVSYSGPVSRVLEAGATAYLPPRPLDQVAQNVRAHLEQNARPILGPGSRRSPGALGGAG